MATRSSASDRGYGSRWQKARVTFLRSNPLCVICNQGGKTTPATVVDHITPHKGDQDLFWDSQNNWQALCTNCHNSYKKRLEMSGKVIGCTSSGEPLDRNHPWNKVK